MLQCFSHSHVLIPKFYALNSHGWSYSHSHGIAAFPTPMHISSLSVHSHLKNHISKLCSHGSIGPSILWRRCITSCTSGFGTTFSHNGANWAESKTTLVSSKSPRDEVRRLWLHLITGSPEYCLGDYRPELWSGIAQAYSERLGAMPHRGPSQNPWSGAKTPWSSKQLKN